eukprot:4563891-Prymnesium_polylepis.1
MPPSSAPSSSTPAHSGSPSSEHGQARRHPLSKFAEALGVQCDDGDAGSTFLDKRGLTMPAVAEFSEQIDHDVSHTKLDMTGSHVGIHAAPLLLDGLQKNVALNTLIME